MHVVIFEGPDWPAFAPISLSRPVFCLLSGAGTLLEKQVRHLKPTRLSLWVRPELMTRTQEESLPRLTIPTTVNQPLDDEPVLLVDGRTLVLADADKARSQVVHSPGLSPGDALAGTERWRQRSELPRTPSPGRLAESLGDLIHWNTDSLLADAADWLATPQPHPPGPYHLIRPEQIRLGQNVTLEPGCVLDAGRGPILLADGATIGANSVVQGPCYIGKQSMVAPLAVIRPGVSIGPMSKVGGEVSNSILLGYSNKSHEGFLGDSYLGKWVNFGAGTTTSNLKNTYGEISVQRGRRIIPTGRRFLGAVVGDHSKTGIHTRLAAGAYVGFCSSIVEQSSPARFVPSYSFDTEKGRQTYDLARAIEVTKRVYTRRNRTFTEQDEQIMRYVAGIAPGVEA